MKRLIDKNKTSAEEYDRVFKERQTKETDWHDKKRWKLLASRFKGGRLVDLGCLDSLVPVFAHQKYPQSELWGIDYAEESIRGMRRRYPYINYETRNVYTTKFPDGHFDYAVAGEVLEHLERPDLFIEEAFRILKPGGIFVLSTPLEETELGEVDHERHVWSFSTGDVKGLLEPYGKVTIKVMRSQKFPIYRYSFPNIIAWTVKN